MPPQRGQKPFDPLSQTWTPQGQSALARRWKREYESKVAEAEWLQRHFKLEDGGRLSRGEATHGLSKKRREEREDALTAFPRMPEHDLQELQRLIGAYGLPLARMDSDTAAFILRRVLLDYFKLTILRRSIRKPMFTPDELIELMRVMRLKPAQLAQVIQPDNYNAAMGNISRWMHGASQPTGVTAMKVNRLIEQQVRRKKSGGFPALRPEGELSDKPDTARRRNQWRKQHGKDGSKDAVIPVSKAALRDRPGGEDA